MGEHFFGTGRGRVSGRESARVDRIARRHGASFVAVSLPGDGPRFWFACPNRGEPFDGATARAVMAEVERVKVSADTSETQTCPGCDATLYPNEVHGPSNCVAGLRAQLTAAQVAEQDVERWAVEAQRVLPLIGADLEDIIDTSKDRRLDEVGMREAARRGLAKVDGLLAAAQRIETKRGGT